MNGKLGQGKLGAFKLGEVPGLSTPVTFRQIFGYAGNTPLSRVGSTPEEDELENDPQDVVGGSV